MYQHQCMVNSFEVNNNSTKKNINFLQPNQCEKDFSQVNVVCAFKNTEQSF